jgi:hypothetical protein
MRYANFAFQLGVRWAALNGGHTQVHPLVTDKLIMLKPASVILGLLFLLGGTIGCFMLAGNPPSNLFHFVPALGVCLIPIGCSIIGFGIRGPIIVFCSFSVLWSSARTKTAEATRIISAFIGYVYGAGVFLFLASFVTLTMSFPGLATFGIGRFGGHVAGTIASLVYTVVLAELVLRPLKHRLA